MIENKYPIFGNGQVINKEALDLLRDNPAELTDLLYLDKKDGIISGFDLITDLDDKKVTVTRGIIKYNEKIFWMNEDYKFNMPEILDIGASNSENTEIENKILNGLEIQEENNNKTKELWKSKIGEIEITRFITRIGAELRNDYNSFRDLRRDFNLLELINIKYSSKHELGTLHPKILKLFGKEASKKENLDIYDVNFYVNCLNGSVERDAIIAYINLKLQMEQENYTNEELYQYLVKILDNLGKDRKITEKKRVIPRKITIE